MKFKVGDIIKHVYSNGIRLFKIENITDEAMVLRDSYWNGEIVENSSLETFSTVTSFYQNSELATAEEIQQLAFPEGLDVVKANIQAGYYKPRLMATTLLDFIIKSGLGGPDSIDTLECLHEPVEYIGFNSRQMICKKCNKNLD
jgi:hypothetical protein